MCIKKFILEVCDDDNDTAYLKLPNFPKNDEAGIVSKQIRLLELIDNYKGPDIYLDIDHDGVLIGIEILVD